MNIVTLEPVQKFFDALDTPVRSDVYRLIGLLEMHGHTLSMPFSKPLGEGLHELRLTGQSVIRILYGFCDGDAVLLFGFKKQRSAVLRRDIETAQSRLHRYCA